MILGPGAVLLLGLLTGEASRTPEQPRLAAWSRSLKLNCIPVKKYLLESPELNLSRALLFKQLLEPEARSP